MPRAPTPVVSTGFVIYFCLSIVHEYVSESHIHELSQTSPFIDFHLHIVQLENFFAKIPTLAKLQTVSWSKVVYLEKVLGVLQQWGSCCEESTLCVSGR